ncbi:MAG: asparagine synthase (glutamine-hydrolyzing), partial [Candidatus Hermodarchaeota archaeon]
MCGIAGILGWKNTNTIACMLDKQKHRGPDGRGIWVLPHQRFSVGHDRLAIIDMTTGMQPTSNEDNSLWLVMNGEIYNYESLREQLENTHTFRSQSDSEVVLHLFEDRGPSCVEKLCGMYSFAIWGVDLGLYLARDPLGIKPLYYGYDKENNFYFSSEIKALIDHVSTIKEFPNGFYCLNSNNFVKYYEVPTPQKDLNSPQEVMNALDHALNEAVKNRLIADVPVGTFLSGGLDSSLITKIAKKYTDKPLNSFSIGLESSSDILNARKVAKHIGTIHHEYILTPEDIYQSLPHLIKFLESCDPALVRSSIPTYFVSKLA